MNIQTQEKQIEGPRSTKKGRDGSSSSGTINVSETEGSRNRADPQMYLDKPNQAINTQSSIEVYDFRMSSQYDLLKGPQVRQTTDVVSVESP